MITGIIIGAVGMLAICILADFVASRYRRRLKEEMVTQSLYEGWRAGRKTRLAKKRKTRKVFR
jgi:hypothetical protein